MAESENSNKDRLDQGADVLKLISTDGGELAAGALKGPVSFATAVASVIKGNVNEWINGQNADLDKLAEVLALPIGATADDYYKHLHDAKQNAAYLQAELAHGGDDPDPIGTQFKLIKAFADIFIDSAKKRVEQLGEREVTALQQQNATPEQITASQRSTQAKIAILNQQKSFFDGSGLLQLERAVRVDLEKPLDEDAKTADAEKNRLITANDYRQQQLKNLLNAAGLLDPNDPQYIEDKKRLADALDILDGAKEEKKRIFEQLQFDGASPEQLEEFNNHHTHVDELIAEAEENLNSILEEIAKKRKLLLQSRRSESRQNQRQAEAAAVAGERKDMARTNRARIRELSIDIAIAKFKEQMQGGGVQVENINISTSGDNVGPLTTAPDQGGQGIPGGVVPIHGFNPIAISSANGTEDNGSTTNQFNNLLSTISENQVEMFDLLKKYRADQGVLSQEIRSLQASNSVLQQQIHALQSTGHK